MSLLETITKPANRPVIGTVCGDAGTGKTSLAATFPKPVFIRAENGLQAVATESRPDAFPVLQTPQDLWDQLAALIRDEHDYKTLVIDSVTQLETMFMQYVVDNDDKKPKSINQALGGYGAGLAAVAAMHGRLRKACDILNTRKGMHIVFLAHADKETVPSPDGDDYLRFSLRLGGKSMTHYVDNVDFVGFLRLQMFVKGEDGERKKAVTTGVRELVTNAVATNVSKNRFGITAPIVVELGKNPLSGKVPGL